MIRTDAARPASSDTPTVQAAAHRPVSHAVNLADIRAAARHRLPRMLFDFVDGGCEGEATLRANERQFDAYTLRPLQATATRPDLSAELFGQALAMPILVAPCGSARLLHPGGECAIAAAAGSAGTVYVAPHLAGTAIERIVAAGGAAAPRPWYQLYMVGGRDVAGPAIARAAAAGCGALVLTLDNGGALRERDSRNRLPALMAGDWPQRLKLLPQLLACPSWLVRHVLDAEADTLPNLVQDGRAMRITDMIAALGRAEANVTWESVAWARDAWRGPFLVKGVLDAEDAARAVACGVDGIIVSNHGGRAMDCVTTTMQALPEVIKAVPAGMPVLLDGGIRRGSDVVKALAAGARAVLVGRPVMFGLALGEPGVRQVLAMLQADLARTMRTLGRADLASLHGAVASVTSRPGF